MLRDFLPNLMRFQIYELKIKKLGRIKVSQTLRQPYSNLKANLMHQIAY